METLEFNIIDKIFDFLPKDINNLIYEFYDNRCKNCGKEMRECVLCDLYFHFYHICYMNQNCYICNTTDCPYMRFTHCECMDKLVCKKCSFNKSINLSDEDYMRCDELKIKIE